MPRRGREQLGDQRYFFVTTSTRGKARLFDSPQRLAKLRDVLFEVVSHHRATLYGYVLMVNHVHLLLRVETGGRGLSALMRDFKRLTARRIFPSRGGIWQRRFDDVAVFTGDVFRTKLTYIHGNPVRAGLVQDECEYEYSSARSWLGGVSEASVTTSLDL